MTATCPDCQGTGEGEYLTFDSNSYRVMDCWTCEGSGETTLDDIKHHVSLNPRDAWMVDVVEEEIEMKEMAA